MSDNAGSCLRASRGLLSLRSEFTGQTVWFTGLPSAGKTSLSRRVETELLRRGLGCYVLDGDELRKDLNSDLDFSDKGRHENIRRFGHLARLMADSGLICLVSVISPFESDRLMVREIHRKWSLRFTEVFVDCPLKICMLRDVKGLYALAGRDSSRKVTGLSAPYEVPSNPEIVLETSKRSIEDCVKTVVDRICEAKSTTTLEHPTNNNDLEIDQVDLQWVQVIAEKWASPLESFMDENDYLQSLHFRSIERNGKRYAQSVPIILPISSEDKTRLSKATGQTIRLVHCGKVYGMLEGASF